MHRISTYLLLILLVNLFFTWEGLNNHSFLEKYKFNIGAVKRGEYYRLITGTFLHAGWGHFFFNMLTLYFFYSPVEKVTGSFQALLIYLAGGFFGNLSAYYFHQNDDRYSAVGASGAVNAIVFATILLYPGMKIYILPIPFPIPAYVYAVGYLLYTTFGMKKQLGNIGHEAHFGGAGTGILLTLLTHPEIVDVHPLLTLLLVVVVAGGFFYIRSKKVY